MPRSIPSLVAALTLALAASLSTAHPGFAQDAIRPAPSVRVVETRLAGGATTREVVRDLLPAEVLRVQVALARAGFDPGIRSGALDGPTRSALRRFQAERGLVLLCGCVSYETLVALGISPRVIDAASAAGAAGSADREEAVAAPTVVRETVIVRDHGHAVLFVPHHRKRHRGAGVVVGTDGSGVFVGHAPAVGAGTRGHGRARVRPPRGGVREPTHTAPSRPGLRIRSGDRRTGSSGGLRSSPPRPGSGGSRPARPSPPR